MTLTPTLIWNAVAIALGVIGGVLFLWAVFWDRSRGRLRCPKCWYDMRGAVEAWPVLGEGGETRVSREGPWTCPECGKVSRTERRLSKARRRTWTATFAAVAILLALYGWSARDRVLARGWIGTIPTIALAAFAPMDEAAWQVSGLRAPMLNARGWVVARNAVQDPYLDELLIRLDAADASMISWRIAMRRSLGTIGSRGGFDFRSRSEWPRDSHVTVLPTGADNLSLLSRQMFLRLRVKGSDAWEYVVCEHGMRMSSGRVGSSFRPVLRLGSGYVIVGHAAGSAVEIEAELLLALPGHDGNMPPNLLASRVVWRGTSFLGTVVDDRVEDLLTPVETNLMGLPTVLSPAFARRFDDSVGVRFSAAWLQPGGTRFALGFRIEVLRDGKVVAYGQWLHPHASSLLGSSEPASLRWTVLAPTKATMREHEWHLRLTGDPSVAIGDPGADSYWRGSVTMPLVEFEDRTGNPFDGRR